MGQYPSDTSEPANPIQKSGMLHELLRELDDAELDQFIRYWKHRYWRHRDAGQGFAAWKSSTILSAGYREASRRGLMKWHSRRPDITSGDHTGKRQLG